MIDAMRKDPHEFSHDLGARADVKLSRVRLLQLDVTKSSDDCRRKHPSLGFHVGFVIGDSI